MAAKNEDRKIKVSLDSGANHASTNEMNVTPQQLGLNSFEEWANSTDDEKLELVKEFFYGQGYPAWGWDDGDEVCTR
jgi:hypothetical protein